jgi:stage III sporulation protein SpoIIIAA
MQVTVTDSTCELIGKFVDVNLIFTENGLEGTIETIHGSEVQEVVQNVEVVETDTNEVVETPSETSKSCGTQVVLSHADSPSDFIYSWRNL